MLTPLYILSCSKQRFISQMPQVHLFLKIIKKKKKKRKTQPYSEADEPQRKLMTHHFWHLQWVDLVLFPGTGKTLVGSQSLYSDFPTIFSYIVTVLPLLCTKYPILCQTSIKEHRLKANRFDAPKQHVHIFFSLVVFVSFLDIFCCMGSFAHLGLNLNKTSPLCRQVFVAKASIKKRPPFATNLINNTSKQLQMPSQPLKCHLVWSTARLCPLECKS